MDVKVFCGVLGVLGVVGVFGVLGVFPLPDGAKHYLIRRIVSKASNFKVGNSNLVNV